MRPIGDGALNAVLAHGGTAGLAIEVLLVLLFVGGPIIALVAFARWQKRQEAESAGQNRHP